MPKVSQMFPSKYLRPADIGAGQELKIRGAVVEVLKDAETREDKTKIVVYFDDLEKGLVLNKTNAQALADRFGDDTDAWAGKTVKLVPVKVEAFGEVVDAIRLG